MKYLLTLLLLLSVVSCKKKEEKKVMRFPITQVSATVKTVPIYLDYIGHMSANVSANVVSQVEGKLVNRHFSDGDFVKAGDLLYTIDPRPYVAALKQAEATLAQNMASLQYAQDKAKRYAVLVAEDYVSQLDFDQYVTDVLVDEATIKENLASIESAQINLDYCYIKAPFDGVTGGSQINVGNLITNASSTPINVVNQITPITCIFYVPELELQRVMQVFRSGPLKSILTLSQLPKEEFEGYVSLINNQVDEDTGSVQFQAHIPNENRLLWPGQFTNVRLILGEKKDATLLPTSCIQFGQKGNYIWVVKEDMTVEVRPIKKGQQHGDLVEVEGLKSDEKIVLHGQVNLYPGAHVFVKPSPVKSSDESK